MIIIDQDPDGFFERFVIVNAFLVQKLIQVGEGNTRVFHLTERPYNHLSKKSLGIIFGMILILYLLSGTM
jgi:hypothetical protein